MAKSKVTSAKLAKLASKVLKGYEPTRDEIESLAACVMGQRERDLAAKAEVAAAPVEAAPVETDAAPVEAAVEAAEPTFPAEATPEAPVKTSWWSRVFK